MAPLLEVKNLTKYFPLKKSPFSKEHPFVYAVDGISFDLDERKSLGLVGESGCGKSTAGRTILRLLEPTAGQVLFEGHDIFQMKSTELQPLRRRMQIIFQDPYASLNPRMTVKQIIGDPMEIHKLYLGKQRDDRIAYILEKVGMRPDAMVRYPNEFSGGQRQRIGIARALALDPRLIVADEPVSALDVSIQAQIINLLEDLQAEWGLAYILISHDLAVVEHICDRIAVMYLGGIVELAGDVQLYASPKHPYTEILLSSIPVPDPHSKRNRIPVAGDVPSPINPPPGCRFHTRCPKRFDPCDQIRPVLSEVEKGHFVACHLYSR
jgi:oligopeptide transport system ATP-binding protein